jgi:hypothetical protein
MKMTTRIKINRQDFKEIAIYFAQNPGENEVDIDINVGAPTETQAECDCLFDEVACDCSPTRKESEAEQWAREAKEFLRDAGIDY